MNKKLILFILVIFIGLGIVSIGIFMLQPKQVKEGQNIVEQKTTNNITSTFDDADVIKKMVGLGFSINYKSVGENIDLQRILLKVNGVKEDTKFSDVLGNKEYQAKKGTKFVFVNISITNKETSSFYMPEDGFTIVDNLKREYGTYHGTYVYKLADSIEEELQPGIEQTGVIVFELPTSSESYALVTSTLDGKRGYIITLLNNN